MKKMAELSSGVLVKFLQEMDFDGNTLRDSKPVLLQIRSIIPLLREGDLWPNQGFFLKVSDLSHALYVSLPQDQDDLVLCNKLYLGQFIHVDKLEAAYPVPMLKGIRPLPGRRPCNGNPKDLIPLNNVEKSLGRSYLESIIEENGDVIKKKQSDISRSLSASKLSLNEGTGRAGGLSWIIEESKDMAKKKPSRKSCSLSAPKVGLDDWMARKALSYRPRKSDIESAMSYRPKRSDAEIYDKGFRKYSSTRLVDDDVESTISTTSTSSIYKRRSWSSSETSKMGDISDTSVVKHELQPDWSSPSIHKFPLRSSRYDSSDDSSSTKMSRSSVICVGTRSSKHSRKSSISGSRKKSEDSVDRKVTSSSASDKSLTDAKITWESLPSNLVKLGQEVLKQREFAVLAAAETLQEASAAERLLKCLGLFSELQSAKGDGQHLSVDKFFSLQDSLAQTRSVVQSLTSISPLRTTHNDPNPPSSVKDAIKLALERKQNATLWIKTALALDLNLASGNMKTVTAAAETTGEAKKINKKGHSGKPKGAVRVRRQMSNDESDVGLAADLDSQAHWVKGSVLSTSTELANSLQDDSRVWFLTHVEDYLDWVGSQMACRQSDAQVAEMMYQIKRVSDWLDMRCKETSSLNDSEVQAYRKVRNKIYEILLKHAERIAMNAIGGNSENQHHQEFPLFPRRQT